MTRATQFLRTTCTRTPSISSLTALFAIAFGVAATSCGNQSMTVVSGPGAEDAANLKAAAGDAQMGTVGAALPDPLSVQVTTKSGKAVSGASVDWSFTNGTGSETLDGTWSKTFTTVTDGSGMTAVYWTLDTIAGDQEATATLPGVQGAPSSKTRFRSHGAPSKPDSVNVSPRSVTLAVGEPTLLSSTVLDKWGNVITGAKVKWHSGNSGVAVVDSTGEVTATAAGSDTITASSGSAVGHSSVIVTATNAPKTVSDLRVVGVTDNSVTLRWTQVDDGTGSPAKYTLRYGTPTLSWSSAYGTEVSVAGTKVGDSLDYTFSGLQTGTTYQFGAVAYRGTLNVDAVFGAVSNLASGLTTASGTVQTPTVTVTPTSLFFSSLGATAQLSAVAKDSTGNIVSNPTFVWKSLASTIASVSSAGLVTAQGVGATAIIVSTVCCGSDTMTISDTTAVVVDTATQASGVPQAPAVGSSNIVFDTRAGSTRSIQAAGISSFSDALSTMKASSLNTASNDNTVYPLDFVTNFDGNGTHAFRFNWTYLGGYTGGGTCYNQTGQEDKMVAFSLYLDPQPLYIQWKDWYGRTESGGGFGSSTVGSFDHSGPAGGHKILIIYRSSVGATAYRTYFGYNGGNGLVGTIKGGYGDPSGTTEKELGLTPHDLNKYINQVVTWTLYIKPESSAGAGDGEYAAWLNDELLWDAKNVTTGETGFYGQQFGGPTWICPQQDQTEYKWDWVEWTK